MDQLNRLKPIIKIFFGLPLTISSFYFIFKIIFENIEEITRNIVNIRLETLLPGIIALSLFFWIKSICWTKIIKQKGHKRSVLRKIIYLYSLSETKRYIPGNIFSFIARIKNHSEIQIKKQTVIKGIVTETIIMVATSLILSILSFTFFSKLIGFRLPDIHLNYNPAFIVGILAFSILIFVLLYFFNNFKKIFNSIFIWDTDKSNLLDIFLLYILAWFFFGFGNFLIASSFIYLDLNLFLPILSLFISSWLIGYLSFITPMGLGVREGVLSIGLSSIIPLPIASSIAIILRVFFIISELLFLFSSFLYNKISIFYKNSKIISLHYPLLILITLIISYIIYFTYFSFQKYLNFFNGRFDLGNMDQTVWNTINGRIFMFTNPDGINVVSRLSAHADFILILLSPVYLIWSDPRMLLLIQTLILAAGSIFVYLLAQKVIKNPNISLILSLSYLSNPFLQKQNLFDFHPVTLATTFLLATFYFLYIKRYALFIFFLILSVLTKENVFLISSIFGIYIIFNNLRTINFKLLKDALIYNKSSELNYLTYKYFLLNKKLIFGIFLTVFSFIIFYILVSRLIPDARGGSGHFALSYYSDFGDTPIKVIAGIMSNPYKIISIIISSENIFYLKQLFLPVGFLILFSPLHLIFSIPELAIILLSGNDNLRSIHYHYGALIIPFLYISTVFGIKNILNLKIRLINEKLIFCYILVFTLYSTWLNGILPGSNNPALEIFNRRNIDREYIDDALQEIPSRLSVASSNNLGAHLSHRENLYTIPIGIKEADIIVFLLNDSFAQPSLNHQVRMAASLKNNNDYIIIVSKGEFTMFAKKNIFDTTYELQKLKKDFK